MPVVHSASMIRLSWVPALALLACASAAAQPSRPAPRPRGPGAGAPAAPSAGPVRDKVATLREAAGTLEKAQVALDEGDRNRAEFLFSTAEMLVGEAALADVASTFRAGAPPRVITPTVKVADPGRQARAVGSSDEDDKDKPERGSLDGALKLDGKAPGGTLEPTGRRGKTRPPKQRIMEQRDRLFAPRLMLIPVGSKVSFPNFDKVFHNVFSSSASAPFDLGLYKEGQAREVTFTKEGIVR